MSNHLAGKPPFWIMYCLLFLYFIEDLKTSLRQMVKFRHYIGKKGLRVSHYLRFPSVLSWSASLLRPQKFEWFLNAAIVTSNRDPPPEVLASTDLYASRVVFKWTVFKWTELLPVFCASLINYIFEPLNNWLVHIPSYVTKNTTLQWFLALTQYNTINFTQQNDTIVHILTWYIEHHHDDSSKNWFPFTIQTL